MTKVERVAIAICRASKSQKRCLWCEDKAAERCDGECWMYPYFIGEAEAAIRAMKVPS